MMSFIPHSRPEWIQQGKLSVFVLALFGYILFLMAGFGTGLGVYRNPAYCWVAAALAIVAFAFASRRQRWIAIAALLIAIFSGLYGYYANAAWRERLDRAQTRESAAVQTTQEAVVRLSSNKQMHRTTAPRCSFDTVGSLGAWIRSQSPLPAVVGDLDRSVII